ncbi:MAG: thiolase family protein [Tractidigestivibacter sp.]|jgi:acetyl-CoA C-acetyltransferase|uniref:thiolase family protein n=1 Tax=Tractidigestivibacter sp. TaxID=2847320 RepID=UPI003D92260D
MAINKWEHDVALIGGGYTKHGFLLQTPELKGKTFRDLCMWATTEACESAGLTMGDVDAMIVSNTIASNVKAGVAIANTISEYVGMAGKPVIRAEEACAGGPGSIRLAADMVASGHADVVAVLGVITPTVQSTKDLQPNGLEPIDQKWFMENNYGGFDYAYVNTHGAVWSAAETWWPIYEYCLEYDVPLDTFTKVMDQHMFNMRDTAQLNPKAYRYGYTFEQEAADHGFDNVMDYVNSSPWQPYPRRRMHAWIETDAAACVIVCRAEDVSKYSGHPDKAVRIGGIGHCTNGFNYGKSDINGKGRLFGFDNAFKIAYEMSDLDPKDIGYMSMHDDWGEECVTFTERAGFIPRGQAWKYVLEGRTRYDGDKPINTHGGMLSCGNGNDATGIAEVVECMLQMRGEAGARQVKKIPEACVSITMGSGFNYAVTVLQQL